MNAPAWFNVQEAATLPRMIIDSFAGGGGASTGIELALGRSPDVAINHSASALALHAANHPETLHLDSNIWDVKPLEITRGRPVGLLWASPDCKHFSKAKGGAPRDRNIRDLAWVIVDWAEQVRPDVILMENVEEFVTWGPLGEDGQPLDWLKGATFEDWKRRLKRAGYRLQHRELRACDYGAPTIRKRFFLIARRDGRPIVWPKPTHGDPKSAEVRKGKLKPWRTAAECIDWSLPCPSIFDTAPQIMARHGLRAVRPLKPNTLARVARGIHRYVLQAEQPFIVNLANSKTTGRGPNVWPLSEALRTITSSSGHALIAPALTTYYGHGDGRGVRGADLTDPLRTVTVENRHALITPSLIRTDMTSAVKRNGIYPMQDPLRTVMTAGSFALITPSITRFNGGATGQDLRDPMATVTANSWIKKPGGAAPLGLIAPVLTYAQQGGANRSMMDPHHTICASRKDQNSLIAATMAQTGYGERQGQAPRALDVQAPLGTVVAGGTKHAPVAVFLAQQNTGVFARSATDPLSTICQTGSHQTLTSAWFAKYYGTGDGARHDDPCHTVTVKDRFAHMQADLSAPPFAPEHEDKARAVAHLLREHGLWDDREFVTLTLDGAEFVIVDIGMRMLAPRELFRAQGFPADYVIEGVWQADCDDWAFKPFAKDIQVSCCGNSVCPPLAEALVRANCEHLREAGT